MIHNQTTPPSIISEGSECMTQDDCRYYSWVQPLPECVNGRCSCTGGLCKHWDKISSKTYQYYCGICGTPGASCGDNTQCHAPWNCIGRFCTCLTGGEVTTGVCKYLTPVDITAESYGLFIIMIVMLIIVKIVSTKTVGRRIRRMVRRCRRNNCNNNNNNDDNDDDYDIDSDDNDENRIVAVNTLSNTKTPSYTLGYSGFVTTSDDPDLELALELSRIMAEEGEDWVPMSRVRSSSSNMASTTESIDTTSSVISRSPSTTSSSSSRVVEFSSAMSTLILSNAVNESSIQSTSGRLPMAPDVVDVDLSEGSLDLPSDHSSRTTTIDSSLEREIVDQSNANLQTEFQESDNLLPYSIHL